MAEWYHSQVLTGLSDAEVVRLKIEDVEKNQNPGAALDLYYYGWDKKFPELLSVTRMRQLFESLRENSTEIGEILDGGEFS